MTSTDVAAPQSAEVEALIAAQDEEFGADTIQVPILKVGQALTKEVEAEQAEAGEFINTLTGEGLGNKVTFIVAYYSKGRFAADRDSGRAYVAFSSTIPQAWEDLVGESFVGTPFDEYPDAEEQYKIRVNNKEISWGSGPLVSTTHNFTGYVIASALEGEDDGAEDLVPVRLSLKRTDVPAARKIITLKRAVLRGKPFWDRAFDLSTIKREFKGGKSYVVEAALGRPTTADEKALAVELAQAVNEQRVKSNDDGVVDAPVEPDANGGLGI